MTKLSSREVEQLKEKLKAFEEDRYCPNGCLEYQLDKLDMYKNYFNEIKERLILLRSCYADLPHHNAKTKAIDYMLEICTTALNGSRWV